MLRFPHFHSCIYILYRINFAFCNNFAIFQRFLEKSEGFNFCEDNRVRKNTYDYVMGTSKNRFEKRKWVEYANCEESLRSKAVCLTRRFDEADGALYTFSLKQGF